ncbi:hypothetical protein HDU98_008764 [Podochytrium sp. JEL0797]|nr:hypothetical protein HDU98_008764 [Podochytrium sp. JEL0797]
MSASAANQMLHDKFIASQIHEDVIEPTPTEATAQKKRVIAISVDNGPDSSHALSWVLDHLVSSDGNDELCLINVRPFAVPANFLTMTGLEGPIPSVEFNENYIDAVEQGNRDESHQLLTQLGQRALDRGIAVRGIALRGSPKEEILTKIEEMKPDMLVVGCRGLNPIKSLFLGSTSNYLVQHSTIPVVVVKRNV